MTVDLLFDAEYYQSVNPDLAAAGLTAPEQLFAHFQNFGLDEKRKFSPIVDLDFYSAKNADLRAAGLTSHRELYEHLDTFGMTEERDISPCVDLKFYQENNADLANFSRAQLVEHLIVFGLHEGRSFSPYIDLNLYRESNADLANFSPRELLDHLVNFGMDEMRKFSHNVDIKFYKDANPDLEKLSPKQAFEHLLNFGFKEGRKFAPPTAASSVTAIAPGDFVLGEPKPTPLPPSDSAVDNISAGNPQSGSSSTENTPSAPPPKPPEPKPPVVDNSDSGSNSTIDVGEPKPPEPKPPVVDNSDSGSNSTIDVGEPAPPDSKPPVVDNTDSGSFPGDTGAPLPPPASGMPPESYFPGNAGAPLPPPGPRPNTPGAMPPPFGGPEFGGKVASGAPSTSADIMPYPIMQEPAPPENATDIGELNGTQNFDDSVSNAEPVDSYRFTVETVSEVSAIVDDLSAGASVNLLDSNGYYINSAWGDGATPALLGSILQPGTYYLQVNGYGGDTNYQLNLAATAPTDIGTLSAPQTLNDSVGTTDAADSYQFTLDATAELNLLLNGGNGAASASIIDSNGQYLTAAWSDGTTQSSASSLLAAGTYYVLVNGSGGGDANYTLNLETAAPTDLGNLSQPQSLSDSLSATDSSDIYTFTLDASGEVDLSLDGLTQGVSVNVLDGNGKYVAYAWGDSATPASLRNLLDAGTYYVQVNGYGVDSNYNLNVSATPKAIPTDGAGNTTGEAADLGTLSNAQTSSDWLGAVLDPTDFYRFTLDTASTVSLNLDNLSSSAYLTLLDSNEGYIISAYGDAQNPLSKEKILQPGTYYLQLVGYGSDTEYDLNLSATATPIPADAAGNTIQEAQDLGSVSNAQTASDWLIGGIDTTDTYRINLNESSRLSLNLDNLTGAAYVSLLDSNGNYVNSAWSDGTSVASIENLLAEGDYYIQVNGGYDGDSQYDLNLSATPTPIPDDGAGNTPEAAQDLGSLSASSTVSEWVGNPVDPTDYFLFNLSAAGEVSLNVDSLSGAAGVYLLNSAGEYINSAYGDAQMAASLSSSLEAGSYYVQVYGYNDTNYNLNLAVV